MKKPERQTYFLAIVREHKGQDQPGEAFAIFAFRFLFAYESIAPRRVVVKIVPMKPWPEVQREGAQYFATVPASRHRLDSDTPHRPGRMSFCYNRTSSQSTRGALSSRG